MNTYALYAFGFFAQALFGTRILVQWFQSEKAGRVVSPTAFWIISLMASFLFLIYGALRSDAVILLGQTLSFYIYLRNLQLKGYWKTIPVAVRWVISPLPPLLLTSLVLVHPQSLDKIFYAQDYASVVMIVGAIGQLMLNLRYLYQWYFSEQANDSVLPMGFWVISAIASVMVVYYSILRQDPVLLVAQSFGFLAYSRNIYLHRKSQRLAVVKQSNL